MNGDILTKVVTIYHPRVQVTLVTSIKPLV